MYIKGLLFLPLSKTLKLQSCTLCKKQGLFVLLLLIIRSNCMYLEGVNDSKIQRRDGIKTIKKKHIKLAFTTIEMLGQGFSDHLCSKLSCLYAFFPEKSHFWTSRTSLLQTRICVCSHRSDVVTRQITVQFGVKCLCHYCFLVSHLHEKTQHSFFSIPTVIPYCPQSLKSSFKGDFFFYPILKNMYFMLLFVLSTVSFSPQQIYVNAQI